ncbi:MAG: hypothetical protein QM820_55810 [Minicystis sp.]
MTTSLRLAFVLTVIAASVAACEIEPPQPPRQPPTTVAQPAPPPPAKCERIEEKCAGQAGKRARIAGVLLTFEPAEGWLYAQGESATVVQSANGESWLAVAGYSAGDQKDHRHETASRDAQLEALGRELQVTLPKKKIAWKRADTVEDVGDLKVSFWELEGATRTGNQGSLLLFSAPLTEGKALLGIAFVPKDEPTASEQILKSIKSISSGEIAAP